MAQIPKDGDFSKFLGEGENPNGTVAQTPNGTMINSRGSDGEQPFRQMTDGERWSRDPVIQPDRIPSVYEGGDVFGGLSVMQVRPSRRKR